MLWRHRSRDQNGPKFNIRSKTLLGPFSKNIFKCGSRKSKWKVCQLPAQRPFKVGIKENFAKGLRVCSLRWRFQFLLISIAFGVDRCLRFFFRGEGLGERRKRGYTFARFLLTATPRHKRLARKKFQGLDNGLNLHFLETELLTTFLILFLWLLSAQGQCILERVSWYR